MVRSTMRSRLLAALFVLAAWPAVPASAGVWIEVGDAGQLPGAEQVTIGSGPLTAIVGTLPTDPNLPPVDLPDIDLFRILITDPAAFSATTVNSGTAFLDTQLYLFRADGVGVAANGNTLFDILNSVFEFRSTIPAGSLAGEPAGEYLLGIALFESRPTSATGGFLFPDLFFSDLVEVPLIPDPLAAWDAAPIFEGDPPPLDYQIDLTGAAFALTQVVPEPTSVLTWLAIFGAVGIGSRRRAERKPHPRS